MKRKTRLRKIRRLRKWRDEIFTCDNAGRMKHLLFRYPDIRGYETSTGGFRMSRCKVTLHSGHEFYGEEHLFLDDTILSVVKELYLYFGNQLLSQQP